MTHMQVLVTLPSLTSLTGLEIKIKAYKNGLITAKELVKYIESTSKQLKE